MPAPGLLTCSAQATSTGSSRTSVRAKGATAHYSQVWIRTMVPRGPGTDLHQVAQLVGQPEPATADVVPARAAGGRPAGRRCGRRRAPRPRVRPVPPTPACRREPPPCSTLLTATSCTARARSALDRVLRPADAARVLNICPDGGKLCRAGSRAREPGVSRAQVGREQGRDVVCPPYEDSVGAPRLHHDWMRTTRLGQDVLGRPSAS